MSRARHRGTSTRRSLAGGLAAACVAAVLGLGWTSAGGEAMQFEPVKTTVGPPLTTTTSTPMPPAAADPTVPPAPGAPGDGFKALDFLTEVYAAYEVDPTAALKFEAVLVPGSVADHYFRYLVEFGRFATEYGWGQQSTVTPADTGAGGDVEVCSIGVELATGTGSSEPPVCLTYGAFAAGADGRLESFTVNGRPLTGRFGAIAPQAAGTATVDRGVAFKRVTNESLNVLLQLSSPADVSFDFGTALYVDPSGAQTPINAEESSWYTAIPAGGSRWVLLNFPGAAPGGSVHVAGGDGTAVVVAVTPAA